MLGLGGWLIRLVMSASLDGNRGGLILGSDSRGGLCGGLRGAGRWESCLSLHLLVLNTRFDEEEQWNRMRKEQ